MKAFHQGPFFQGQRACGLPIDCLLHHRNSAFNPRLSGRRNAAGPAAARGGITDALEHSHFILAAAGLSQRWRPINKMLIPIEGVPMIRRFCYAYLGVL